MKVSRDNTIPAEAKHKNVPRKVINATVVFIS